jgi:hypothetical protein
MKKSILTAIISLSLSLVAASGAKAASFSFTKIADSDADNSFGAPSLNNLGELAFNVNNRNATKDIFRSDGIATTKIAETGNKFFSFGNPSINDSGTVTFSGFLNKTSQEEIRDNGFYRESGIFKSDGNYITIVDNAPLYSQNKYTFLGEPTINNLGTIAFPKRVEKSGFSTSNGIITASQDGGYLIFEDQYSEQPLRGVINDRGVVAYSVDKARGSSSELVVVGETTNRLSAGRFLGFDLNNNDTLAFISSDGVDNYSLFKFNGNATIPIADRKTGFTGFDAVSLNDGGSIAVLGTEANGKRGIFAGKDSLKDKVITVGDSLLDSTVTNLFFSRDGLNNSGQIAFLAELANGRSGVFRADIDNRVMSQSQTKRVAEPSSILGILLIAGIGWKFLVKSDRSN